MVSKKGYIRTLEAVIAIVIILIFIFAITPKEIKNPNATPPQVESAQKYILKEIANKDNFRKEALDATLNEPENYVPCDAAGGQINSLVQTNLPPGFAYSCAICANTGCVYTPQEIITSVYMDDVMITPVDTAQSPRIIRLWFWQL